MHWARARWRERERKSSVADRTDVRYRCSLPLPSAWDEAICRRHEALDWQKNERLSSITAAATTTGARPELHASARPASLGVTEASTPAVSLWVRTIRAPPLETGSSGLISDAATLSTRQSLIPPSNEPAVELSELCLLMTLTLPRHACSRQATTTGRRDGAGAIVTSTVSPHAGPGLLLPVSPRTAPIPPRLASVPWLPAGPCHGSVQRTVPAHARGGVADARVGSSNPTSQPPSADTIG